MKICNKSTTLCIAGILSWISLIIAAYVPNACYITRSKLSPQEISPCTQLKYHHGFNCTVKTVTELINDVHRDSYRLIIFLPGMHFVQGTRKREWSVDPSNNITFKGIKDNVTVCCKEPIVFALINMRHIVLSGIHFQNCSGRYSGQVNKITFFLIAYQNYDAFVSLTNIHISSRNSDGIKVKFKSGHSYFSMSNSTLSTGSNGVHIYDNESAIVGKMTNVFFNGSCLFLKSSHAFNAVNVTFIGCNCSPALTIINIRNCILRDVTFNTTRSRTILHSSGSQLYLQGQWNFYHNKGGVAITSDSHVTFFKSTVKFIGNINRGNAINYESIVLINSRSTLAFNNSHAIFEGNHGNLCGGLMAKAKSSINFNEYSTANFTGNHGTLGGAVSLNTLSVLKVSSVDVTLWFTSNEAQKGGAIFIQDNTYAQAQGIKRAMLIVGNSMRAKLKFDGNTATVAGNNIYGSWIDWFFNNGTVTYTDQVSKSLKFTDSDHPGITSDPIRICVCINSQPDCNITKMPVTIFSGHTLPIDIVAVGQNYGTVGALAEAKLQQIEPQCHDNKTQPSSLERVQAVQRIRRTCTKVMYSITSKNSEETLLISVYESVWNFSAFPYRMLKEYPQKLRLLFQSQLKITVGIRRVPNCSPPFQLNETELICVCPLLLTSVGLLCDSNGPSIIRTEQQWIDITYLDNSTEIIAHERCPYDYCRKDIKSVLIRQEYQNLLCAFNRTGIMCGGCQARFSRVLGSSKCKECSNLMLLAIIPADLVAGLLLIIILTTLNLTVSVGTINGLIFYVNVIQAQRAAFFPSDISASFLGYFIAWLNLDQGVESCLYDGFDSYTEIWLQFCFPFYIGLLMICIIVSSHYSVHISRLSSKNAVQVLATLYLLSYTKLLRLISDVASSATITYPTGQKNKVWLYDGNINYLKGKHILLFIITILLIVLLSVPYTLSLVSIQWLMKLSHYRVMFWINKMKPLFDAYTGPFKPNHRYWIGLLLTIRIILLVIFALNENSSSNINLICITVFSFVLLAWLYLTGWIYERLLNNCLEFFFLLNLGLTTSATLFYGNPSTAVICTSTGIAFIIFVGIIIYHIQRRIFLSRFGAKLKQKLCIFQLRKDIDHEREITNTNLLQTCSPSQVTYTVVELTEPLLESEEERGSQRDIEPVKVE